MRPTVPSFVIAAMLLAPHVPSAQAPGVRITYLYDNTVAVPGTKADWGFACLVEAHGKTVLAHSTSKAGSERW